jgi:hypothetical protein
MGDEGELSRHGEPDLRKLPEGDACTLTTPLKTKQPALRARGAHANIVIRKLAYGRSQTPIFKGVFSQTDALYCVGLRTCYDAGPQFNGRGTGTGHGAVW